MEPQDEDQHPSRSRRLLVAMKPSKTLDQMTPEERREFFGRVFDKAHEPPARHAYVRWR